MGRAAADCGPTKRFANDAQGQALSTALKADQVLVPGNHKPCSVSTVCPARGPKAMGSVQAEAVSGLSARASAESTTLSVREVEPYSSTHTPRRLGSFINRVMIMCNMVCSVSSMSAGASTNSGAFLVLRRYTPSSTASVFGQGEEGRGLPLHRDRSLGAADISIRWPTGVQWRPGPRRPPTGSARYLAERRGAGAQQQRQTADQDDEALLDLMPAVLARSGGPQ